MSFSSDKPLQSNQLPISIDYPLPSDQNFLSVLSLDRKRISDSVNSKVGGIFSQQENANFCLYNVEDPNTTSNSYRKCFNITQLNGGNIAGGATVNFAHNIDFISKANNIIAQCTSIDDKYFSVMYPYVYLDTTNVYFTNPLGVALTTVYVVAEYLKG